MGDIHYPLQKTLHQTLAADAGLAAMITGIFDRPPQQTLFPYITIGDIISSDWSSITTDGHEIMVSIHVWSREGGRKQASLIMNKVYDLLHHADLAIDGYELVLLRFAGSNIELANDGWTYQGKITFQALIEAN